MSKSGTKFVLIATTASIICSTTFTFAMGAYDYLTGKDEKVALCASQSITPTLAPTVTPAVETVNKEKARQRTIKAIDAKLGGKLTDKGASFYKYATEQDVNSKLLAAMCIVETTSKVKGEWKVGTSKVLREHNNVAGINWNAEVQIKDQDGTIRYIRNPYKKAGWYNSYPSVDESIKDMAQRLKWWYIDEGKCDIYSIGGKWAPTNDPRNGIGGMDNHSWPSNVTAIYNELCELENKEV